MKSPRAAGTDWAPRHIARAMWPILALLAVACSVPDGRGGAELIETEHGTYELRTGRIVLLGDLREGQYMVTDDSVVIEGDILVGEAAALERLAAHGAGGDVASSREALAGAPNLLWTSGRVPYVIQPGVQSVADIEAAVVAWNAAVSAVRLVRRTTETDYVQFQRSADGGCNSYVGRIGGAQPINVADWCTGGNLLHEIAHAAGVWHEQSRADRDTHLIVDWSNIDPRWHSAFDTYLEGGYSGRDIGPFDFESVMLYGSWAYAIDTSRPTLRRRAGGATWEQNRERLSAGDLSGIAELYGGLPATLRPVARYYRRFEGCSTTDDGGVPGLNVDHNYTLSAEGAAAGGYVAEGAWFMSYQDGACPAGTTKLHRFMRGAPWDGVGDRVYRTTSTPPPGYYLAGSPDLGCVATSQLPGTVPLYQLYSGSRCVEQHRLLLDAARRDALIAAGRFESFEVVGYVWPIAVGAIEPPDGLPDDPPGDTPPGDERCPDGCSDAVLGTCVGEGARAFRWCDADARTAQRCVCSPEGLRDCSECAALDL